MRPAGVSESVTVTGESPMIDTQRTDVSNVVGEKALEDPHGTRTARVTAKTDVRVVAVDRAAYEAALSG